MQRAEKLNTDWAAVSAAIPNVGRVAINELASVMSVVALKCAEELRRNLPAPLTE